MLEKLELLEKLYWMNEATRLHDDSVAEFKRRREEIKESILQFCRTNGVEEPILESVKTRLLTCPLPQTVFITDSQEELTKEFNPWRDERRHDIEFPDTHFVELESLLYGNEVFSNLSNANPDEAIEFRLEKGNQAFYSYQIVTDTGGIDNDRTAFIILMA